MYKTAAAQFAGGAVAALCIWAFYKIGLELWCVAYGMFM